MISLWDNVILPTNERGKVVDMWLQAGVFKATVRIGLERRQVNAADLTKTLEPVEAVYMPMAEITPEERAKMRVWGSASARRLMRDFNVDTHGNYPYAQGRVR